MLWNRPCIMFRDRVGVKPLFYTRRGDTLVFASETERDLRFPRRAAGDRPGRTLRDLWLSGRRKHMGKGVFRGINEVLPGHCLACREDSVRGHLLLEAGEPST